MFNSIKNIFKKNTYSLKQYLTKDKNGITMLENLLKNGTNLSYSEETKLINSIEAGYIYAKCNKSIHRFKYTEDQLFTKINDMYFIEYLCSIKNINYSMIEQINNHIEIIDILIKYDKSKLFFVNKEIINKLLVKDINDNYLIEKYIEDENTIKLLLDKCDDGKLLLKILVKNKNELMLKNSNEEALMTKINSEETLLDYLLNKHIIPNKLKNIPNNKKFINFLINKNLINYLINLSEKELLIQVKEDKTILEILLEKNGINKLNFTIFSEKTIELLKKYNKLGLIDEISIKLLKIQSKQLMSKKDDKKIFLEYLLDNGYKFKLSDITCAEENDKRLILSILYDREEFELISRCIDASSLFYSFEEGCLLIDKLLKKNLNIFVIGNIELKILLNNFKQSRTYLDVFLEKIKEKKIKYNLCNISFSNCDINDMSLFYITLAKKDMMKYIRDLNINDLLKEYNGKLFIDVLLDKDKELTINKILTNQTKSSLKISTILRSRGIEVKDVNVPLIENSFASEYLKTEQYRYGIGPIQKKGEYLLKELKKIFLSDGKSNTDLTNALILGYKHALIHNYDFVIKELEELIILKKINKRFSYLKIDEGNYFRKIFGSVFCDTVSITTLMHETGHALHYYNAKNSYPNNLEQIIEKIKSNKEFVKKVKVISERYNVHRAKVQQMLEFKFDEDFNYYYTSEKTNEINEYLQNVKKEIKKDYINLGIDENLLNKILEEMLSIEEYIKCQKRIIIEEQINNIMCEEYGSIMAISDILDAILEGDLFSENLIDEENKIIESCSGHGIPYYSCDLDMIFREMIANFSLIIKSNDSCEYLELLKNIIGEELYDLISNYYFENIVGIEKNKTYKKRK